MSQTFRKIITLFLKGYRYCISPLLGQCCRFYPSCSEYSQFVFEHHSLIKALGLTLKRLLKCHPWHPGGLDNPPGFKIEKK